MEHELTRRLKELADPAYREFQCRLMPTVDPARVLGVRMPQVRALAREVRGTAEAELFLSDLPHFYYDENNLHGALVSAERDVSRALELLDAFLPHVDNWATCDLLRPAAFRARPECLPKRLRAWMASPHEYTARFGLEMLMWLYLDEAFTTDVLEQAASVPGGTYYLDMMLAWFFATALDKQWDAALPYVRGARLSARVRAKAIQKALESRRIPAERKDVLRALRGT